MQMIEQRSSREATTEEPQRRRAAPRATETEGRTLRVRVCVDSGKLARRECPNTRIMEYPAGSHDLAPRTYCDIHRPAPATAEPARGERTITLSVCAESGKLATEYCPHIINKEFAPSAAPTATCDIHKPPRGSREPDGTLW